MNRRLLLSVLCLTVVLPLFALGGQVSVAGFYPLDGSGRAIYNFNQGWRFRLGNAEGAERTDFDDSRWEVVCAPHTCRLEPSEASGGRNYQGVCWYRKHFTMPADMEGRQVTVHFEAVMGKQEIYVNGKKVKEHLGGYLPVTVSLTEAGVKAGQKCLIAVKADNSDDKTYPPGKKQSALDFAYHGGMYRDVWLIGKSPLSMTDAIEAGKTAGGGVFVHYDEVSEDKAVMVVDADIQNLAAAPADATVEVTVKSPAGKTVGRMRGKARVAGNGASRKVTLSTSIRRPDLWSPASPRLYLLKIRVLSGGKCLDGGIVRTGIRKAEFRGKDGFWLNGRPYGQLIGGNRHQDFAYVGNALPNSQQWRDARRLKDAGMDIIRAAHYPQDPSFMDACDELGIFIIVPTPGWQYWNKDATFAQRVHQNTRDIIRRDRNHPSVLMWEPILNETRFPEDFSLQALRITQEEYPYAGRPVAVADMHSAGVSEHYDVVYGWPEDIGAADTPQDKCVFTREFGEYVDDWYAHNALNRSARSWGERPMLTAALSLADTYGKMYHGQRQFIGGCQWHPFDHQRGYHPDPYFGGIYDAFRQKKYAFEMFRSQRRDTAPMVFIANEMTQFSDSDVVVFSNCDSVRLTALEGDMRQTLPVVSRPDDQPSRPVVFRGFWNFWKAREYSYRQRDWQHVTLMAEGIRDGKVVCREKKMPSRRSTKIRLYADTLSRPLLADGSDFIVVVAEVTDDNGNVRRMAKENILFKVEGEGRIIGDASIGANPRVVEWGSAPVLVRATNTPGRITVTARPLFEGTHAPEADTLTIESVAPPYTMLYEETPTAFTPASDVLSPTSSARMSEEERRRVLDEVEQQQQEFGVK